MNQTGQWVRGDPSNQARAQKLRSSRAHQLTNGTKATPSQRQAPSNRGPGLGRTAVSLMPETRGVSIGETPSSEGYPNVTADPSRGER